MFLTISGFADILNLMFYILKTLTYQNTDYNLSILKKKNEDYTRRQKKKKYVPESFAYFEHQMETDVCLLDKTI
jgi:hypothetical protein